MPYPYDLVAIDVDGTLINSEDRLTPATKAMIQEVQSRNIRVTLASGRPRLTLAPLLAELHITEPYISSTGAHIIDPANDKTLYYATLPKNALTTIAELARAAQVPFLFQESDRVFYEGSKETLQRLSDTYKIDITVADKFKAHFIGVEDLLQMRIEPIKVYICGAPSIVQDIEEQLHEQNLPIYTTYSAPPYLEITSSDATKGEAIKRLTSYLGIPLERVIAIGDSLNDLPLFQVVGTKVAMGNAHPQIKAIADRIAPTNDEDGVAWALRELVLKEV